jgi:hypothetical protein
MKRILPPIFAGIYTLMMTCPAIADGFGPQHREQFRSGGIIVALGIMTISALTAAFLTGYFMPKARKKLFPWHKRIAMVTLLLAASHALMVLLFH